MFADAGRSLLIMVYHCPGQGRIVYRWRKDQRACPGTGSLESRDAFEPNKAGGGMTIDAQHSLPRHRFIARLINAEPGEVPALLLSFGFFFCILCGYYIQRPMRDEANVFFGREFIAWAFTITFIIMLALVPAFGWLVSRVSRRVIIPWVYVVVLLALAIFWALLSTAPNNYAVGMAFVVWVNVFILFVVSLFWSFMTQFWTSEQAKRLFGAISIGGSLGGFTGPLLIQALVRSVGAANLLIASFAFTALGLAFYYAMLRLADGSGSGATSASPEKGGILDGALNVWRSPYLFRIGMWVLGGTLFGQYFLLEQASIFGGAFHDRTETLEMQARIENATVTLTMLFEFFVTARLIAFLGLGRTMALSPIGLLIALVALWISPTVAVIATISVMMRALDYGITGPAMRVLWTIVDPADKYRAQNFNDTLVYRGGGVIGSWGVPALMNAAHAAGFAAATFVTLCAAPVALAWAWLALDLGKRFDAAAGGNPPPAH
jgi:AAA family ATP:ADP antiporter